MFSRNDCFFVAVYYRRDAAEIFSLQHGNRLHNSERVHKRTKPSTLLVMQKTFKNHKTAYRELVAEKCPPLSMPVKHLKAAKQIRDHQFIEKKKKLINNDDLYGAFKIAHTLPRICH